MRNQQESNFVMIVFEDLTFDTPILSMKVHVVISGAFLKNLLHNHSINIK
jgi:hypothetical protein